MTRHLSLLVTALLLGCAGATQELPVNVTTTTGALVAANVENDALTTPRVAPTPVETFTDDQILGLLATFNTDEIDLATVAQERTKDPDVRRFAVNLQREHAAARDQEARLSERLVMRPATTDKMRAMQVATAQEVEKLKSLSGHELDVEYVSNQVDTQRDALAMIDVQLVPSARISEVRAHLASFRESVDHHLRDGEALKRSIGGPIVARR